MHYFDTSIPWAIQPEQLHRIEALAAQYDQANAAAPQAAKPSGFGGLIQPPLNVVDGVAVIDIRGPMTKAMTWLTLMYGGTSMAAAGDQVNRAAQDPKVSGILLRVDSGGGTVDGTEALARSISAAGATKSVLTLVSGCCASAAYWAGSAANAVYLSSQTDIVGSIGVCTKHVDVSGAEAKYGIKTTEIAAGKYKRIASAHEPLSADGRSNIQEQLDHIYGVFVNAVASHRGASVATVLDRMADGRIFHGQQAIVAGLADGFATEAELINRLRSGQKTPAKTRATAAAAGAPQRTFMNHQEIVQAAFEEVGPKGTPAQYQAAIDRLKTPSTATVSSLTREELSAAALAECGPNARGTEYKNVMARLSASTGVPEPKCQRTGLTAEEKVAQAQAHATANGCSLIESLKALGFAK